MTVRFRASRRALTGLAALAVGVAAVLAVPAAAYASSYAFMHPTSTTYTDSAAPTKSFTTSPAWIGTWTDEAGTHTSRAYYTFDLSAYRGATLISGAAVLAEASVNDCTADRRIEIWQTDGSTKKITWNSPPAEARLVASAAPDGLSCPSSYIGYDIAAAVKQALAGTGILTLEVRVPDKVEAQAKYGRSLASLGIQLVYNHAPDVPTGLGVRNSYYGDPQQACGDDPLWVRTTQPVLAANLSDVDANQAPLSATFEIWPVGHPDQKTQMQTGFVGYGTALAATTVTAGVLTDGGKYVWRVHATDELTDGGWSGTCRINVDTIAPTGTVTVNSTDYPGGPTPGFNLPASGGPGIPGTVTLSAGGDKDIVGFRYFSGYESGRDVAADAPGGSVDLTITPATPGFDEINAFGIDKAGNTGPEATYWIRVKNNAPVVTDLDPDAGFGQPRRFSFAPSMDGVVRYEYSLNGGPTQTVTAQPDGTAGVTLTPDQATNTLAVTAFTASGLRSWQAYAYVFVDTSPKVSSREYPDSGWHGGIGVPGTFTTTATMPDVVSFNWSVDYGDVQSIPADGGTATFSWTPQESGSHIITVTQVTSRGYESDPAYYYVTVNSNQPTVTSDVYQVYTPTGGPGVTGHFVFTAHQSGAVTFVYTVGAGPEQSIPVGPDGTATISFTPTTGGAVGIYMHTVDADGNRSEDGYTSANVDPKYPVIDQATDGSGQYTFTFTAVLDGSTDFVYSLDGADPATIAVGPDGTATIVWTPTPAAMHSLAVYSRAGDLTSATWTQYFWVF